MKWLFLFLALPCLAQLPVVPDTTPPSSTVTNTPPFANLVAWYKHDAGKFQDLSGTPAGTNTPVRVWQDQTANHFDLTNVGTASKWPTNVFASPSGTNMSVFFSDSAWSGTDGCILSNAAAVFSAAPYTFFAVIRKTGNNTISTHTGVIALDVYNTNNLGITVQNISSPLPECLTPAGVTTYSANPMTLNQWYVLTFVADTSNMTFRTNGVPLSAPPGGGTLFQSFGIHMGSGPIGGTFRESLIGDIVEVLVYQGNETGTAQLTNTETYLFGL